MSFSQFIKDYIDTINNFYDSFSGNIDINFVSKFFLFYIGQSFKLFFQYIFTFRWLNDFYSIKVNIPQLISSNLTENYSSGTSGTNLLYFLNRPDLTLNFFLFGLSNSIILSIPSSSSQILWLRRLTIEGIPSGFVSGCAIFLGQFLISFSIIIGFRFIIFTWYSFEFVNTLLGVLLIIIVVYKTARRPLKRIKFSETEKLVKIFLLHFVLTCTEQATLFQYFSNLSFSPGPTLFEILDPASGVYSKLSHWSYISGLLFGGILWTTFFGWAVLAIGYSSSKYFKFPYSIWVRNFNNGCLTLLIAFTITSLPYYNLDFLVTSPLGFIPQDDALKETQLRVDSIDLKKGRLGEYSSHTSLDTDVSTFDRGRYKTSSDLELTFEDLNYQGEYVWRSRGDRLSSGSAGVVNKLVSKFLPRLRRAKTGRISSKRIKSRRMTYTRRQILDSYETENLYFVENDDLMKRFLSDYQVDVTDSTLPEPYDDMEQEPYSAFSELARYGFDSFAAFEELESDEFEQRLGRRIKSKYYLNPVYKSILGLEISNFMNRQPKNYSLKKEEENILFKKRLILANYYNDLSEYFKTPYAELFDEIFLGPKSYANRVYNQQYKGTLKILRRLFSISLEGKNTQYNESILKFDQPLYKPLLEEQSPALHEEVIDEEDLELQSPFLQETNPIPFYAGWDEKSRRFFVTNYWLSYPKTGTKINQIRTFGLEDLSQNMKGKNPYNINFITWPLSKSKIEKIKYRPQVSANLMSSSYDDPKNKLQRDIFEYAEADDYDIRLIYETLPSLVRRVDLRDKDKGFISLKPLRGGFVWRGSEIAKVKISEARDVVVKYIRDWRDSNP
nr:hypothetical protein Ycf1 [Ostreobium quekettii]